MLGQAGRPVLPVQLFGDSRGALRRKLSFDSVGSETALSRVATTPPPPAAPPAPAPMAAPLPPPAIAPMIAPMPAAAATIPTWSPVAMLVPCLRTVSVLMSTCCPSEVFNLVSSSARVAFLPVPGFLRFHHAPFHMRAFLRNHESVHGKWRIQRAGELVSGLVVFARKALAQADGQRHARSQCDRRRRLGAGGGTLSTAGAGATGGVAAGAESFEIGGAEGCSTGSGEAGAGGSGCVGGRFCATVTGGAGRTGFGRRTGWLAGTGFCTSAGAGFGVASASSAAAGGAAGGAVSATGTAAGAGAALATGAATGFGLCVNFMIRAPPNAPTSTSSPICKGFIWSRILKLVGRADAHFRFQCTAG